MKRKLSYGYPLPGDDAAQIENFAFAIGDSIVGNENAESVAWDYETPITCTIDLNVDLGRILNESGLQKPNDPWDSDAVGLAVALSWASSATRIRGASSQQKLRDGQNLLEITLDGENLGGTLTVQAVITLAENVTFNDDRLAPTSEGMIIWSSDVLQLPLEGGGSRFTMTPVSFKEAGVEPLDAMWLVQLSDSLDIPISSGVRVLVNTSNPITKTMLETPNSAEANFWRKELETEVITLLIHHGVSMLQQDDFDSPMEPGSLGEGIQGLMNSYFPQETPTDLINELPRISATARAFVFNGKDN